MNTPNIVVFLGPSMSHEEARRILDADYRPPIQRGDLLDLAPGTIVAVIDGVFEQSLSVSPREIGEAVARGLVVFGGSSMGALRAAEVPGMIGVGRIFEWYRDEIIVRDDEVALLFDATTGRALTVPMVNVRFAVERLCRPGTIDRATADRLLSAALELQYERRRYRTILERAGLGDTADRDSLIAMLESHDLKHLDAQAVLEAVDRYRQDPRSSAVASPSAGGAEHPEHARSASRADRPGGLLVWESGDEVGEDELFEFLIFTGKLEGHLRSLVARQAIVGRPIARGEVCVSSDEVQSIFTAATRRWGWVSSEEAKVTLTDLGLGLERLSEHCTSEAGARRVVSFNATRLGELREALRAELFMDEMALKRETMRLASLRAFASLASGPVDPEARSEAQRVLCKVNREFDFSELRRRWAALGLADRDKQDAFVEQLARARQPARTLADAMNGRRPAAPKVAPSAADFELGPRPKPPGEPRFCLPLAEAIEHAKRLREVIGITRLGMIGELGEIGGLQIAQAARPGNAWSSSYGSGKSVSREGAIIGSVMEETEKWAQEKFRPQEHEMLVGSYAQLRERGMFVDPATLDLPYDSTYRPDAPLSWYPCFDLLAGDRLYLPVDVLHMDRRKHDICFSARGARKLLATNGLGSGFSREEATLHGLCEFVERHATRLAELLLANPGGLGPPCYRFVDLGSGSARIADIVERLSRSGATVRVLNVTADIAIPTFIATVTRELQRADGYATHPNPETAIEMALLEAAQTICSVAAGGREDLSIRARSLGRHERPRPVSVEDAWYWLDPDPVVQRIDEIAGLVSDDVHADLEWCVERVRDAGLEHVGVLDLSTPEIAPACVVRVIVPGLESNSPFFTGLRARLILLRDLLPRWR